MVNDIFNSLANPGGVRQPRGIVKINGEAVRTWLSWTVANNSYYEADTYHVVFGTSGLPDSYDEVWFSNQTETFVEILAGFPANVDNPDPNELTSLIYGRIDDMEYDPVQRTITLTGRDLTAVFIDARIATDFANKKASDIVLALAAAHGLSANVTPTKQPVGNYFNIDHMLLAGGGSEWDLLAALARGEGFVVYVSGQTLYFGADPTGNAAPLTLTYVPPQRPFQTVYRSIATGATQIVEAGGTGSPSGNFETMSFSRSQTVAKGITVTVQAAGVYNQTVKKSYPTAPKAITPGKSSPFGATTNYYFNMPAGTALDKLALRAEAIYNQIISHEMKLRVRLPADATTTPQTMIQVKGTRTAFDQIYFSKCVTRTMDIEEGFTMDIEAQNTSPNLAPAEKLDNQPNIPPVVVTATKL